jgi:hypothetical protein
MLTFEYRVCPMCVSKALAAIFSCSLHVILISKMTPRYLTLFTNWMFRPFSWRSSPGILRLLEKQIAWVFPSLIFMFQRRHHDPTAVRPRWSLFNTRRSCFSVAYTQVSSANRARCIPGARGHHFCINCTVVGQGRNRMAPLPLLSWAKKVRLLLKL